MSVERRHESRGRLRFRRRGTAVRVALVVLGTTLGTPALAVTSHAATAATCSGYQIDMTSAVASNFASGTVRIRQYLLVRNRGVRKNQAEVFFTTQRDLNAAATPGQLELTTNSFMAQNAGIRSQLLDLARVTVSGSTLRFTIDTAMSNVMPQPNVVVLPGVSTSAGGLGGLEFIPGGREILGAADPNGILQTEFLIPRSGGGTITFAKNGTLTGRLDISASQLDNPSNTGRMVSRFTGRFMKQTPC